MGCGVRIGLGCDVLESFEKDEIEPGQFGGCTGENSLAILGLKSLEDGAAVRGPLVLEENADGRRGCDVQLRKEGTDRLGYGFVLTPLLGAEVESGEIDCGRLESSPCLKGIGGAHTTEIRRLLT